MAARAEVKKAVAVRVEARTAAEEAAAVVVVPEVAVGQERVAHGVAVRVAVAGAGTGAAPVEGEVLAGTEVVRMAEIQAEGATVAAARRGAAEPCSSTSPRQGTAAPARCS